MESIIYTLIFAVSGMLYFFIGIKSYAEDTDNRTRKIFLVICTIYMGWSLMTAFMNICETAERAVLFRNLGVWFFSLAYPVLVQFILSLAKIEKVILKNKFRYVLLYIPAIVSVATYFFISPYTVESMKSIPQGWTYSSNTGKGNLFADLYIAVYAAVYLLSSIVIVLVLAVKRSDSKREKSAYTVFAFGIVLITILGGITDLIMPLSGRAFLPPVGMAINVIPVILCYYFMNKFSFASLNIKNMLNDILKVADDGIVIVNHKFDVVYVNKGFLNIIMKKSDKHMLNRNIKDVIGVTCDIGDSQKNTLSEEIDVERDDGSKIFLMSAFSGSYDVYGDFLAGVYIIRDITELREKEMELEKSKYNLEDTVKVRTHELELEIERRAKAERDIKYLAYHDPLTGLMNRNYIMEEIRKNIDDKNPVAKGKKHLFFFIDFNKFKEINDTYGHYAGDIVLVEMSQILRNVFKDDSMIARIGGDECLVFVRNRDYEDIHVLFDILRKGLEEDIDIGVTRIRMGVSCGVSVFPEDGNNIDELVKKADTAMYRSKHDVDNRYYIYGK